uniref:Farnesyl pyrophosphate synthase n=2 Tax=Parascaris univalens TaxID=6257 RepID=A0A915B1M8_PARUN
MSRELMLNCLSAVKKSVCRSLCVTLAGDSAAYCANRIDKLFEHAVIGGKCVRGRLLVAAYNALDRHATRERIQQVATVGACLEILQAFFLIFDDVMDGSTTRRGKPCWHTMPDVGLNAINDGLLLDSAINGVLNDVLENDPNKDTVSSIFLRAKQMTVIGQMLDNSTSGLKDCTWERYGDIVTHKTSYYTCFAPLRIAMLLADRFMYADETERIAFKLGYLFQAQDDYLDCFGDPLVTGKIGSDLREGKCTWVTCKAAERLRHQPQYTAMFEANFGRRSDESEMTLRKLLGELRVEEEFGRFEAEYSRILLDDIECFKLIDLRSVLRLSLSELFNRKKRSNSCENFDKGR